MLRLLAEVESVRKVRRFRGDDGLERSELRCRAKIKSTARSTFRMPRGLKGRTLQVSRTCIDQWMTKPGDMIVLDPAESEKAVREYFKVEPLDGGDLEFPEKRVRRISHDSDGLVKYVIENSFLRSVISPDYGARIERLWNLGTSRNELHSSYRYGADGYVEMGGIEESLSRVGKPPDLWNALFKTDKSGGGDVSFVHSPKKREGLKDVKSFLLMHDAPVLCQSTRFEFKPKKPKKGKGKKRVMELNYVARVFFGIGEKVGHTNLFFVPTEEQLVEQRYSPPAWESRWSGGIWDWRKKWHAVRPGFALLADEETRECMAILVNPRELSFAWIGRNRATPSLYLSHKPKKMKPGETLEYSLAVLPGIAYAVTKDSLLLVARGKEGKHGVPYSVVYRAVKSPAVPRGTFSYDTQKSDLKLKSRAVKGVGEFFCSSFVVESAHDSFSAEIDADGEHLKAEGVST
jgi:hypothetical protein